jgi:HPt (histidine-containing phosphotransfer) domain-containing protein
MLADNFYQSLDTNIANLKEKCASKETKEIANAAHYIKGASSSLGMEEPSQILHNIEDNAREGKIIDIDFEYLEKLFEDIRALIFEK